MVGLLGNRIRKMFMQPAGGFFRSRLKPDFGVGGYSETGWGSSLLFDPGALDRKISDLRSASESLFLGNMMG